jgi:hypothetical protein
MQHAKNLNVEKEGEEGLLDIYRILWLNLKFPDVQHQTPSGNML